jgi:hypothetical protein
MYLIVNRSGVIVDTTVWPQYVKLQFGPTLVVGCSESEGFGVSGVNGPYTLIRADTNNSPDAVEIIEVPDSEIPENYEINKFVYDKETQTIKNRYTLEEAQALKQEENKAAFAAFLVENPITWTDGKKYGVTESDQSEITLNINQYNMALQAGVENPTLEWHACKEECQPWELADLVALGISISNFVYPYYHKMQQYKTEIYGSTDIDEVLKLEFVYE